MRRGEKCTKSFKKKSTEWCMSSERRRRLYGLKTCHECFSCWKRHFLRYMHVLASSSAWFCSLAMANGNVTYLRVLWVGRWTYINLMYLMDVFTLDSVDDIANRHCWYLSATLERVKFTVQTDVAKTYVIPFKCYAVLGVSMKTSSDLPMVSIIKHGSNYQKLITMLKVLSVEYISSHSPNT